MILRASHYSYTLQTAPLAKARPRFAGKAQSGSVKIVHATWPLKSLESPLGRSELMSSGVVS